MDDPIDDMPTRARMLYKAARLTVDDRQVAYGSPVGNMQDIATMWTTYMHIKGVLSPHKALSGEDVAHMMVLLKVARTMGHGYTPDTYVDSAGYSAIAGECAEAERVLNAADVPVDQTHQ